MRRAAARVDRAGRPGGGIRVLAVSDEVEEGLLANLGQTRLAELIVACGDLPAEYLGALMSALDVPLVFVPGNHDPDQSGSYLDRDQIARRWFTEEFTPVVRMLRAADLVGPGTDAEAYMRVASQRYRLMRTHEWNDEVIERLRQEPS